MGRRRTLGPRSPGKALATPPREAVLRGRGSKVDPQRDALRPTLVPARDLEPAGLEVADLRAKTSADGWMSAAQRQLAGGGRDFSQLSQCDRPDGAHDLPPILHAAQGEPAVPETARSIGGEPVLVGGFRKTVEGDRGGSIVWVHALVHKTA